MHKQGKIIIFDDSKLHRAFISIYIYSNFYKIYIIVNF